MREAQTADFHDCRFPHRRRTEMGRRHNQKRKRKTGKGRNSPTPVEETSWRVPTEETTSREEKKKRDEPRKEKTTWAPLGQTRQTRHQLGFRQSQKTVIPSGLTLKGDDVGRGGRGTPKGETSSSLTGLCGVMAVAKRERKENLVQDKGGEVIISRTRRSPAPYSPWYNFKSKSKNSGGVVHTTLEWEECPRAPGTRTSPSYLTQEKV